MLRESRNEKEEEEKSCLDVEEEPARVFDEGLNAAEEANRLSAVDEAMVVAQREVHHWADFDLVVDDHRSLLDDVHPKNGALWHVKNGSR
mmetsp:Transcript_7997/g.17185  ORF Transcript_7997/g.17185 Transcript_7997/m.17185 type:complete len:90 (-) Transcript_7997:1187-1456(-)